MRDGLEKTRAIREQKSALCGEIRAAIEAMTERFTSDIKEIITDLPIKEAAAKLPEIIELLRREQKDLTSRILTDKRALEELIVKKETAAKNKADAIIALESAKTLVTERTAAENKSAEEYKKIGLDFESALLNNGFLDAEDYGASIIGEAEINNLNAQIREYEKTGELLAAEIRRLESETEGKDIPDLGGMRVESDKINRDLIEINAMRDGLFGKLNRAEAVYAELTEAAVKFEESEVSYTDAKQLSDAANGRLDFETYAQVFYFDRVLRAANIRLSKMSRGQYALRRKTEAGDARKRFGLGIEVTDSYTGKPRPAESLSGGESFMASLSLALGLSDVVQQNAGGVRLDAMFIDEGFGSLDSEVLDLAVKTLSETAGADRIIGIISHVAELRERIDMQIRVTKTASGSRAEVFA